MYTTVSQTYVQLQNFHFYNTEFLHNGPIGPEHVEDMLKVGGKSQKQCRWQILIFMIRKNVLWNSILNLSTNADPRKTVTSKYSICPSVEY